MKRSDIEFRNVLLLMLITLNVEGGWKILVGACMYLYLVFYFIELWKESKRPK